MRCGFNDSLSANKLLKVLFSLLTQLKCIASWLLIFLLIKIPLQEWQKIWLCNFCRRRICVASFAYCGPGTISEFERKKNCFGLITIRHLFWKMTTVWQFVIRSDEKIKRRKETDKNSEKLKKKKFCIHNKNRQEIPSKCQNISIDPFRFSHFYLFLNLMPKSHLWTADLSNQNAIYEQECELRSRKFVNSFSTCPWLMRINMRINIAVYF